jgi:hypothetical protein
VKNPTKVTAKVHAKRLDLNANFSPMQQAD